MSKVSVIVAVFNAEKYIRESLDSVFNQTFQDFELILINDACIDGTRDILIEYTTKYNNVRLLENKNNEGCTMSRNRGLLAATGEYIAIHDADDISLPYRLEKQVEYLDVNPDVVVLGGHALKISGTGETIGSMVYPPKNTARAFFVITHFKLNPIIDPSCMYRRKIIIENGGYTTNPEFNTAPDFELWCRLLLKGYLIGNLQEFLIKYRINPKGVTRARTKEMLEATDIIWASFKRHHYKETFLRSDLFEQDFFTEFSNNSEKHG